jgi:AcrR family transcriptional regulator
MTDAVKRGYRSDLRSAQARETKRRIVAAAASLFVEQGFGATTVDAIAEAAAVSRKTVFTAVGGKVDLLALALDWAIAGDDTPLTVAERPEVRALLALDDPVALLTEWARVLVQIDIRVADLFAAMEAAAALDPAARVVFENSSAQRRDGARLIVEAVDALGGLARTLRRAEAVDIAWLLSDPVLYRRLVGTRGWSLDRFRDWLAATLRHQLLDADSDGRPPKPERW